MGRCSSLFALCFEVSGFCRLAFFLPEELKKSQSSRCSGWICVWVVGFSTLSTQRTEAALEIFHTSIICTLFT